MIKKISYGWVLVAICVMGLFSCKKYHQSNTDPTLEYFPLTFGKYVTFNVDSVYYFGSSGIKVEVKSCRCSM